MSLRKLKKRLAIDQRNLIVAAVVQDLTDTVRVRTATGEIRTAAKVRGTNYQPGQRVQIATDGSTTSVTGTPSLAELGGEVIYNV